jgi:hypothetical protein
MEGVDAARVFGSAKGNLKICSDGAGGAPPLSAVVQMVATAKDARNWPEVLRFESRLEEMLLTAFESRHPELISSFATAHLVQGHYVEAASLFQRRVQLLGKLERFRDQGADMCQVGECFLRLNNANSADAWYQKVRKLGEKLPCFELECTASLGLGRVEFYMRGRLQEAEKLLRHALTVVGFVEGKSESIERDIKVALAKVLMQTGCDEEAGPLIQRLRVLARRACDDPLGMVATLELGMVATLEPKIPIAQEGQGAGQDGDTGAALRPHLSSCRARFLEPGSHLSPPPVAPTRSGRQSPSIVWFLDGSGDTTPCAGDFTHGGVSPEWSVSGRGMVVTSARANEVTTEYGGCFRAQ